jgi:hypothetical protein
MTSANIDRKEKLNTERVLMFSQRNVFPDSIRRNLFREFEDVVGQIDAVELLAPKPKRLYDLRFAMAKQFAWHFPVALNPGIAKIKLKKDYDLFVAACTDPTVLLNVNAVQHWKDHCKTSICLLDELWIKQIPLYKHFFKILSQFDYVMFLYSQSVKAVNEIIGDKCFFLAPAIDVIRFCPYPDPPRRVIDVYSYGRKSKVTHEKLLRMVKERNIFYLYDTIDGSQAISYTDHRDLLANMAKRSRYFIVNPGLIDQPIRRGNQIEFGYRFAEGAASGAIMIGESPNNDAFNKHFDWPDAVVELPFDSESIDIVMDELDKQPDRKQKIRKNNVVQSLRRHDWVYRWEEILKIAKLKPMPQLVDRKSRLENLARTVEEG